MSILSLPLMIEIVQISVKDNIHLLLFYLSPLYRTPTRRVLETRCKISKLFSYTNILIQKTAIKLPFLIKVPTYNSQK